MENDIKFWHRIKLRDGTYTNGTKDIESALDGHLFNDLYFDGKSVLDVGCWDGAFSFMAEQRGASRVVSFDAPSRRWGGTAGYEFLHKHFESKCEFVVGDIYTLSKMFKPKEFDIVLCYGVLYHMSDPILGLNNLYPVCKTTIAFEGIFGPSELPLMELWTPIMLKASKNHDTSTIWRPSVKLMTLTASYQGFALRKITEPPEARRAIVFDRLSEPTFKFPNTVFPSV